MEIKIGDRFERVISCAGFIAGHVYTVQDLVTGTGSMDVSMEDEDGNVLPTSSRLLLESTVYWRRLAPTVRVGQVWRMDCGGREYKLTNRLTGGNGAVVWEAQGAVVLARLLEENGTMTGMTLVSEAPEKPAAYEVTIRTGRMSSTVPNISQMPRESPADTDRRIAAAMQAHNDAFHAKQKEAILQRWKDRASFQALTPVQGPGWMKRGYR